MIPKSRWTAEAEQLCNALGSFDIVKRIDEMSAELASLLEPITQLLEEGTLKGEGIRLENDELVVPGVVAKELSQSTLFLREQINLRLPKVGLVEMMREAAAAAVTFYSYVSDRSGGPSIFTIGR